MRSNEEVNQWLMRYWQFAEGNFTPGKPNRGQFFVIGKDDNEIYNTIETFYTYLHLL